MAPSKTPQFGTSGIAHPIRMAPPPSQGGQGWVFLKTLITRHKQPLTACKSELYECDECVTSCKQLVTVLKALISVVYKWIVTSDELVAKFISAGVNFFSANRRALSTKSVRIQGKCQPEQY